MPGADAWGQCLEPPSPVEAEPRGGSQPWVSQGFPADGNMQAGLRTSARLLFYPLPLTFSVLSLQAADHVKNLIKALETREPQNPSLHLKKILVISRLVRRLFPGF